MGGGELAPLIPHHLRQMKELTVFLTSCSTQGSMLCSSPGHQSRVDPANRGMDEPALRM